MERAARRRLSATCLAAALGALCGLGVARGSAGPVEQSGIFALLGGTPKIVSKFWAEHASGLTATLTIRQFALDGKTPILDYDVDMQKLMHLIVVRDDFATFAHIHPAFDTTSGTFSQPFTKEPNHRYYVYADTTPHGVGQQVFRFTIESDGRPAKLRLSFPASAAVVAAGPYTVTLSTTVLPANRANSVDVTITKNGQLANDLDTYLGAAAHAVFIGTSTLEYVHVHPSPRGVERGSGDMDMEMNTAWPLLTIPVPALPAETYKLWIEFRGSGKVYTAPFTIFAR